MTDKTNRHALGGLTRAKSGFSEKTQDINRQAVIDAGLPKRFAPYAASEMRARELHKRKKG